MATIPAGSSPHLVRALNSTPVGNLATFSLDSAGITTDPRDTSAQIPTLSATLTNLVNPVNTLIDDDVTFRDWSGQNTTAKVKAVKRSNESGLTTIDTSTIFARLNTEQTTYPVVMPDAGQRSGLYAALRHWCLMAGVPPYRAPGNLLQALPDVDTATIGYLADSPAALRFYGPPDSRYGFVPTQGTYLPNIEVNAAQSIMVGAQFGWSCQCAEFRINAWLPGLQQNVLYTVRLLDNTYSVVEKVGANAETVLMTASYTSQSNFTDAVTLRVSANATDPTKVDLTLRIAEGGKYIFSGANAGSDIYTDFTATGVASTLTQRPLPTKIELGYDSALKGTRTDVGNVTNYFLSEGSVLPEIFPIQQVDVAITNVNPSANDCYKVPGFTGNVWEKMKEFCSITEMDIFFTQDTLKFRSRNEQVLASNGTDSMPPTLVNKGNLVNSVSNRDTAKYVDVNYREMLGSENNYTATLLWKADSVYSINKGEYREEIVQTTSTFTQLDQPLVVGGEPVPYTWGYGSYTITGNDGYIVDPQWWLDNGGYIRVEATDKAGEIKIKLQAPQTDTSRAPYRVSEGVADRPALYITGSGLNLGTPKVIRLATGVGDAAQEAVTFDSIFITSSNLAYNAGYKVAQALGGADEEISFDVSKAALTTKASSGPEYSTLPQGALVYQDGATYRITGMSMKPMGLTVSKAEQFTTIATVNDGLGPNATVDDWNNLHLGKSVNEVNLSPLPLYNA